MWIIVIIFTLLYIPFTIFGTAQMADNFWEFTGLSILFFVLFLGLSIAIGCLCWTVAINTAEIEPVALEEVVYTDNPIIINDDVFFFEHDGVYERHSYIGRMLTIIVNEKEESRVEIWEAKWQSPVRQFLYGNIGKIYIIYSKVGE